MSRPDRQGFLDRVDRKVHSLRGSGLSERHLRLGVLATAEEGWPWRDSIVLRLARQAVERETPRARAGWERARARLVRSVPGPTWRLWLEPVELLGEEADELLLAAPTGVRAWVERRYLGLIREAVRAESDFVGVRFAAITLPDSIPQEASA